MPTQTCNTCTREAHTPFHVVDAQGKTIMGCVDACHADHLVPATAYSRWFNRPEAKRIRAADRKRRMAR